MTVGIAVENHASAEAIFKGDKIYICGDNFPVFFGETEKQEDQCQKQKSIQEQPTF